MSPPGKGEVVGLATRKTNRSEGNGIGLEHQLHDPRFSNQLGRAPMKLKAYGNVSAHTQAGIGELIAA